MAKLAFPAMVAGTLAAFMTACFAGMLADPSDRLAVDVNPVVAEPAADPDA